MGYIGRMNHGVLATVTVTVTVLASGCGKRDPAPTELEDLARYVFANWDDDALLPEASDNLLAWLTDNIDSEQARDGLELEDLASEDLADVEHPDAPLEDLIGACGAARSPFGIDLHAGHMVLGDQVFSNPKSYDHYDRTVTEGEPDVFVGGVGLLRTSNDVQTTTLGVTIPYILLKDYKWVQGETSRAILARSWIEEESCNDGGGNCLVQTYSVDMFFDHSGETWRMTAGWNQLDTSIALPDATLVKTLADGIQDVFRYTDEFLAD
ncbi:MAG: hypothetical protein ABMB14_36895 [Myxococcota bacterium]